MTLRTVVLKTVKVDNLLTTSNAGRRTPGIDVYGMAQALASSRVWNEMPQATLVVRRTPTPTLVLIGELDQADEARISFLHKQLDDFRASFRYVSYAQAEQDCQELALKLVERLGHRALKDAHFAPIPRGGFIVLGMLAYLLDLSPAQMDVPTTPDKTLVVVDDCALTGSRFAKSLQHTGGRDIVFAHLYSHPELRQAIEANEPGVTACISARDLHDYAPERLGADYPAWRAHWQSQLDDSRYWVGQPEHICFAWSEPDRGVWNHAIEQVESAWRLVPPDLCLKNRLGPGETFPRLQVQPEGRGPLGPSGHVLFGELQDRLVVAHAGTGQSFGLSGVAADMWRAIIERGTEVAAASDLAKKYEVDEATLRADLDAFVSDLLAQGLLERREARG